MKRTFFEKLGDFVLGRGFYIVLFLCVATIGISGYFLMNAASKPNTTAPVTGQPTITIPDGGDATITPPAVTTPPKTSSGTPEDESTATQAPKPVEVDPEPVVETPKAPAVYTWPVKGEVLLGHSLEVLAYDETMGDWRIHAGMDIAAETGTQVLAVSDGTVQAVFADDLMGWTVVIDHGEGLSSTYCSLSQGVSVHAGDSVSTGTILGVVGDTAIAEIVMASHLHLEMVKDGVHVDPVDYLPAR